MCKVLPNISGCFWTMKGASIFLRLRSIVNAVRKRGWEVIAILGGSPESFFKRSGIRMRHSMCSRIA